MIRTLGAVAVLVLATLTAQAHFVFIVPDAKDPAKVIIVLSEELEPDDAVTMDRVGSLKLQVRDSGGKVAPAAFEKGKHSFQASIPGSGPQLVFGSVPYGVMQKGDAKPYLLAYHPKAFIGAVPADGGKVSSVAAELIPTVAPGKVKFQLLGAGKPVADAEVTVLLPDGKKEKAKTDKEGFTKEFAAAGRYGAWVRFVEAKTGELDGKKYDEIRHYPTLVLEVPAK